MGKGETSKVNTTGSYGPAQYICHLEEERKKKNETKCKKKQNMEAVVDLHQSATDSDVCLQTQLCLHIWAFYSFITKNK